MTKNFNKNSGKFLFKKHANIGANDALDDKEFLYSCFVNTGDLESLIDTRDKKCIILGRTGSGKTALIEVLKSKEERVAILEPDSLALTYLSNNSNLSFYSEIGIKIDVFYQLLWRHILIIEIIKMFFDTTSSSKTAGFLQYLREKVFKKKSSESARDYLVRWGEMFWKEIDYQITEYTQKLETDINQAVRGNLAGKLPAEISGGLSFDRSTAEKLTEEQKAEIVKYAQPVVDKVQIKQMSDVIALLEEELLDDRQKRCYIAIDRLDERWVNDTLRYRLIRALFEAVRYINSKLPTVKVIVSIREDLLARVFRFARDAGDQQEKYESLYLRLRWEEHELETILDYRVNQLMRDQYTKNLIRASDVLPPKVLTKTAINYIIDRTLRTPRDAIMFFNYCLMVAYNETKITQQMVLSAEQEYSDARLRALGDEWSADYVDLVSLILAVLKKKSETFVISELESETIQDAMLEFLTQPRDQSTHTYNWIYEEIYQKDKPRQFIFQLMRLFYQIGIIGLKVDSYREVYWSYKGKIVTEAEIDEDTICTIHSAFHRVLGIRPKKLQ